jgi:hypothetical protein
MVFTVEVRLIGGDLVTSMSHMRTWLDHQRIEPDAFRHSSGGAGITFRVDFKLENDAAAFARAFGGRLVGLPAHREASLWASHLAPEAAEFAPTDLEPTVLSSSRRS